MTPYDIAGHAALRYKNNQRDQSVFIAGAHHILSLLYGIPFYAVVGEICEYFDQPLKQDNETK